MRITTLGVLPAEVVMLSVLVLFPSLSVQMAVVLFAFLHHSVAYMDSKPPIIGYLADRV